MQADARAIRISAAIRVGVAILLSAAITAGLIAWLWGPLEVKTDVVGFPTFHDFNYRNWDNSYYLTVAFFPLLAFGLFLGLTRIGPRIGLAAPAPTGRLRPESVPEADRPRLPSDRPLSEESETRQWGVCAGRTAAVGAVLGLETAVTINSLRPGLIIGILGWAALAALGGLALGGLRAGWPLRARIAVLNSFGGVLCFAGLLAVSMSTKVTIASNGDVVHYPWLPAWLALPIAALLAACVVIALRRAGDEAGAFLVERRSVLLLVMPVALVLTLQLLPGDTGPLDYFHGGEQVVGAHLLENGFFPWSELVLTHGLAQDAIYDFARGIFGGGLWGHIAGISMIMRPLYMISVLLLLVYLVGRNWLFLFFCGLMLLLPMVVAEQFRLILWPLILILLGTDLDRPSGAKSTAIAFLLILQTLVTPEALPAIPAVAAVLVAYEWYWRRPGSDLRSAFPRTLWVGVAGIGFAALAAGFLAAHHALDDYVYTSINIVHGHAFSGALPPGPGIGSISNPLFVFIALTPVVALLLCFAYGVARLRLRRPIYTEDWVMAAAALFVLVYYAKFLSRMDTGHVYQPFVAGFPLFAYIVYRVVSWFEGAFSKRMPDSPVLRLTTHPLSLLIVIVALVLSWSTYHDRIGQTTNVYRPAAAEPIQIKKVGYTQSFPTTAYRDMKRVIDSYLAPDDRLYDFSNTPLLFFYLIDRFPSTRYFHASITFSAKLQQDVIDRLERKKPKLIVFDNDSDPFVALSNWDGLANMVRHYLIAQWILDNYKPLLWDHGFTVYARRDQPPASQSKLQLTVPPVTRTSAIPFTVQPCNWGTAPSFLSGPGMPDARQRGEGVGARARRAPDRVTLIGWAGDPKTKQPAREVIATVNGKVVGRVKPGIDRPDLVAYGLPEGYEKAGFQFSVPAAAGSKVNVYGVSAAGNLTELVTDGEKPEKGTVTIDGEATKIDPVAIQGQINSETHQKVSSFELPAGKDWTDYRWLEVDAGGRGFVPGTFTVYDKPSRPSEEREISFKTLSDSPRDYTVPVGSCAQWHGYRGDRLYLNTDTPQDISAVRLIP